MAQHGRSALKTTETSLEIVDVLLETGPVSREVLESRLGLTPSTTHRHLATLRSRGYVVRDSNEYRLSYKFLTVGGTLRRQIPGYPMIKQKVDDLADATDERAQFIVRECQERVYLYTEIGDNPVQTGAHTGRRGPVHASAAGKAILANLPERKRNSLLDSLDLTVSGPNTITDVDELRENLTVIRDRGYALNLEESTTGVNAIGAAVLHPETREPIGGVSVSGPATRLKRKRMEDELVDLVLGATNELELYIEHS